MAQRSVSVLFTGQLREKAMFERSLEELSALSCVKEFILSTWHSEALANADYLQGLQARFGLRVVTATDPALPFDRFNGFRQSVSIRHGLKAVSKAQYVFKTRTDCHIDAAALAYLAAKDHRIDNPATAHMRIFREKVSVTCASPLVPFYIDDKLLFGHRDDLMKLCSTDFLDLKHPSSAKFGHYIRFYPAFMAQFPMFREFIRREILITASNVRFRELFLPSMLQHREYGIMLLAYYRILSEFFCLDWNGHAPFFRGEQARYIDGSGELAIDPDQFCSSNAFFREAADGRVESAALGQLLAAAAGEVRWLADMRDIGCGIDWQAFWQARLVQAKGVLQYDKHVEEARRLMRAGEMSSAFNILNMLLPCDPGDTQLLFLMGACYDAVGDRANAIAMLRDCLELGDRFDSLAGQLLRQIEART